MNDTIKRYVKLGVHQNKLVFTKQPSVVFWSTSRKCIVGENGIESLEVIDDGNGNLRLSGENNIPVSMSIRTELTKDDINKINNSNGIICTDALYGKDGYRFGFIPV